MKDGIVAYDMMREFGLGITNADLLKIPVGLEPRFPDADSDSDGLPDKLEEGLQTDPFDKDTDNDGVSDADEVLTRNTSPTGPGKLFYISTLRERLKGRILLQVESRGEAWYVHPQDKKRYYMKDGDAAYQIMRFLSLGINNSDLQKIPVATIEEIPTTTQPNTNSPLPQNLTVQQIVQFVSPALVHIESTMGTGSGMIIEKDGIVLTNAHVVQGVNSVIVRLNDKSVHGADVIGRDETIDLAILRIETVGSYPVILFGESTANDLLVGEEILAFGFPLGLSEDVSVTRGILSARQVLDGRTWLQTDATIHPGNSGGPLVDSNGYVIGINTAGVARDGVGGTGISFAIPITEAKKLIPDLKKGRNVVDPLNLPKVNVQDDLPPTVRYLAFRNEGVVSISINSDDPIIATIYTRALNHSTDVRVHEFNSYSTKHEANHYVSSWSEDIMFEFEIYAYDQNSNLSSSGRLDVRLGDMVVCLDKNTCYAPTGPNYQ